MNKRGMARRAVLVMLVLLIAGGFIGAYALRSYAGRGLPELNGAFAHESLSADVRIVRDDWGVPHIAADNAHDAYFAFGFAVTQDRAFQLELLRRLGTGQLAEVLGEAVVPLDKVARTMLWRKTAERLWADRSVYDPEFVTVVEAFVQGINHAMATLPKPIEFTVLGIEPQPFTEEDCLSMMGYMAFGFAEAWRADALYTIVENRTSPETAAMVFPGYAGQTPVSVKEGRGNAALPEPHAPAAARADALEDGLLQLAHLAEAALKEMPGFHGSNSWIIGPSRSESGGAILANDPHIGFSNPAVWYEAHIRYPGFESYGVHLPLIPFAMIAHNRDKAWALTMFMNDDLDLYAEEFDPENPARVRHNGGWTEAERWTETILVRGDVPVELEIVTTPRGPVITEMLEGYEGPPVSAWWQFIDVTPAGIQAFYEVGRASNLDEMRAAVSRIEAPGLNFSYADREGNIAWWAAGRLPIRPAHVNPKRILDGASGRDEPLGWLPFEMNPQFENPPGGIIVTSNNLSTTQPLSPVDELDGVRPELAGYWQTHDRAGRILDLLEDRETWSLDELKAVQTDTPLRTGRELAERLLVHLEGMENLSGSELAALNALSDWDGDCGVDSIGATVYHVFYDAVRRKLLMDEIGEAAFASYVKIGDSDNVMQYALRFPESPLWDDVTTEDVRETMEDMVRIAFRLAVSDLRLRCGEDPATWNWGRVHTVDYSHVLGTLKPLNRLFNIGPFPAPGTWESVAKMAWDEAYRVEHGASMRLLLDYAKYGETDGMWMILPTGNSGHFLSRHFRDQAQMYLAGEYRPIRFAEDDIARTREYETVLSPAATLAESEPIAAR
jgi:penicillin G amidase